jgi:hypothetical protein
VARRAHTLLLDRPSLAVGVTRRQLLVDEVATDPNQPVLRRLAEILHRHHIGALSVMQGVQSFEFVEAMRLLSSDAERQGPIVCDDLLLGAGRIITDLLKPGDLFGQLPGGHLGVLVERERDLCLGPERTRGSREQVRSTNAPCSARARSARRSSRRSPTASPARRAPRSGRPARSGATA